MRMRMPFLVGCCLLTGAITRAAAAPITYSEAVSGDLSDSPVGAPVFTLDVGANTVDGHIFMEFQDGLPPVVDQDQDSFGFILPAGTELVGITWAFTPIITSDYAQTGFDLDDSVETTAPFLAQALIDLLGGADVLPLFSTRLPLHQGTYWIQHNDSSIGGPNGETFSWSADYTWTLTVREVPEPATLLLVVTGVSAIAARRSRTRRYVSGSRA